MRDGDQAVADVEIELGALPPVTCVGSEVNLVLLNLVAHAAHAVRAGGCAGRGTIRVRTQVRGGDALISVAHTPAGSAAAAGPHPDLHGRESLAISRWVIVKHGGDLTFRSDPGGGVTATIRLPIGAPPADPPREPGPSG